MLMNVLVIYYHLLYVYTDTFHVMMIKYNSHYLVKNRIAIMLTIFIIIFEWYTSYTVSQI